MSKISLDQIKDILKDDPELRAEFATILEHNQEAEPLTANLMQWLCSLKDVGPATARQAMFEFAVWLEGELGG